MSLLANQWVLSLETGSGSEENRNPLEQLWSDDLLGRRVEAELFEKVLVREAGECSRPGREHAFVLALDAA